MSSRTQGMMRPWQRVGAGVLVPGLAMVALMLLWAIHDGGYDADTWYWGALGLLGLLGVVLLGSPARLRRMTRSHRIALLALAGYVAWSYLSITWASSAGDALDGSNRALMYLVLFTALLLLPWTAEQALIGLVVFVLGVGVVALFVLLRLASGDHVPALVIEGRLASPTGYFNATAALFTMDALAAIVLAVRRELPSILRGLLLAIACAGIELALIVQSRGWLFTLPVVIVIAIVLVSDRLRVTAAAAIVIGPSLAPLHRLLHVYDSSASTAALNSAAGSAGKSALAACGAVFLAGMLIAGGERRLGFDALSPAARRRVGGALIAAALAVAAIGGVAATHGHPVRFLGRQWNGFSHVQTSSAGSHFADVGSGRYDFWRVSLDAFAAHPIGGLGQDNFADYYVRHRRNGEEPKWTHSLEMRLLAHTGLVGFALFATFLAAALAGALRARRRAEPRTRAIAGAALLPLVVWLVHGSVDWFWEVPALTGPALGFLAVGMALGERAKAGQPATAPAQPATAPAQPATAPAQPATAPAQPATAPAQPATAPRARRRISRAAPALLASAAFLAATVALAFPYLAVREISTAANIAARNPRVALHHLSTAADLNPFSAEPARLAGSIALQAGRYNIAEQRFRQAIAREPGGWFAWLGDGLAASALGDAERAYHDFRQASIINSRQPAIQIALSRVFTTHPLGPAQAFRLLVVVH